MHDFDALRSDQLVPSPLTFLPTNPGTLRHTPSIPKSGGSPNCPLSQHPASTQATDLGAQLGEDDHNLQHSAPALSNNSTPIDQNSAVTKTQNKSVNQDQNVSTVTSN